jgi:O-antigen ligase
VTGERLLARIGLAGVLVFLPFGIAGEQIALGIGLLGLAAHAEARKAVARFLREPSARGAVVGAGAWALASIVVLLLSGHAGEGTRELRKLFLLPALVLPAAAITGRRDLRFALAILLLALAAASGAGLLEQARGGGNHPARLDGPIGFYMTTAGVFLLLSLVALAAVVERGSPFAIPAFLAGAVALAFTYTRGAWIGFGAGLAVLLLRRRPRLLLPAIVLLAAFLLSVPSFRERISETWEAGFAPDRERAYVWEAGRRAFLEHPWRGAGLQDLAPIVRAYRSPEASAPLTHFHSLYLQTAVAMGVPGLVALSLLLGGLVLAALSSARRAAPGPPRALAEGALAALVAFLVHGVFEWNLGDSEVALTLYLLVGLGMAAGSGSIAERDEP